MKPKNKTNVRLIDSQIVFNDFKTPTESYKIDNNNEKQLEFIANNKNSGWINALCQLTNSNIFVRNRNEDVTEINVQFAMTEQLRFDFFIEITKGKDVFDFIPRSINFEFTDIIDEIFNGPLEISINDLGLFIERILEIRNQQLYKEISSN